MEQLDGVMLSFQKNFDKGIQKARTVDAFEHFKKVLVEMIEVIDALKEDYNEPKIHEVDEVYTVKELSKKYRISTITLYKLIKANKIQVQRFGNKIRISKKAFEVYKSTSEFDM
jgi:excisionase family DNA binding protein